MRVPGIDHDPERGLRICQAREARGLTQVELGERVGVTGRRVSAWESGQVLTHPNLRVLADELEVTADYLLTGQGERRPLSIEEHDARMGDALQAMTDRITGLETRVAALSRAVEQLLLAEEPGAPPAATGARRQRERRG